MAKNPLITPDALRQLFDYDPATGFLFWRKRPLHLFNNPKAANSWNARCPGTRADKLSKRTGYCRVLIFDAPYLAHRVIWAILHGDWPKHSIDHINGNKADNTPSNLRDVVERDNRRNSSRHGRNTSGVSGVRLRRDRKKRPWIARIYENGQVISLGSFSTFEAAVEARKAAEAFYGYHPNHGR